MEKVSARSYARHGVRRVVLTAPWLWHLCHSCAKYSHVGRQCRTPCEWPTRTSGPLLLCGETVEAGREHAKPAAHILLQLLPDHHARPPITSSIWIACFSGKTFPWTFWSRSRHPCRIQSRVMLCGPSTTTIHRAGARPSRPMPVTAASYEHQSRRRHRHLSYGH
jgi:hypothetical protein